MKRAHRLNAHRKWSGKVETWGNSWYESTEWRHRRSETKHTEYGNNRPFTIKQEILWDADMARGARLTYPPENGFLCPLLLVYNFCVIWATLLSPDVLNRGHPGLFNNISLVGWPFLDLTRQEITKKVKLRDTFSLGSQEDIIKVQLKCFLPEVLFLGLSF